MDELRKRAEEARQDDIDEPEEYTPEAAKTLIHELRVHQVELEMQNQELLAAQQELDVSRQKYADLYNFAPVGYCTLERDGTIREVNVTAAEQLGAKKAQLLGTRIQQYVAADDQETIFLHLRNAFRSPTRQTCELRLLKADGSHFYVQLESLARSERFSALLNAAEAATTNAAASLCRTTITDISERKRAEERLQHSLAEKSALLHEVYHRTRNNMQVICGLLWLQSQHLQDKDVLRVCQELQNRIEAMALAHEKLYQSDATSVNLQEYIEEFSKSLPERYQALRNGSIALLLELEPICVSIDFAGPFGLLLHELFVNALEHAFPEGRHGDVRVVLCALDDGGIELRVSDNGVGMPADADFRHPGSLGFTIIRMLAEQQLQGRVELHSQEQGTELTIRFKKPSFEKRI